MPSFGLIYLIRRRRLLGETRHFIGETRHFVWSTYVCQRVCVGVRIRQDWTVETGEDLREERWERGRGIPNRREGLRWFCEGESSLRLSLDRYYFCDYQPGVEPIVIMAIGFGGKGRIIHGTISKRVIYLGYLFYNRLWSLLVLSRASTSSFMFSTLSVPRPVAPTLYFLIPPLESSCLLSRCELNLLQSS